MDRVLSGRVSGGLLVLSLTPRLTVGGVPERLAAGLHQTALHRLPSFRPINNWSGGGQHFLMDHFAEGQNFGNFLSNFTTVLLHKQVIFETPSVVKAESESIRKFRVWTDPTRQIGA